MLAPSPSDAELAALRALHAHRFPQLATLRPPADGGAGTVTIPLLLGNPSGACRMPAGAIVSDAWRLMVPPMIAVRLGETDGLADEITRDCVLWPDPGAFAEIIGKWPALTVQVARMVHEKVGGGTLETPRALDPAPSALPVADHPRCAWRWIKPRGATFAALINPPEFAVWQMFTDEIKRPGADHWRLVSMLAAACVPAIVSADGSPSSLELVGARWPGAIVALANEAAGLGGAGADAELGE